MRYTELMTRTLRSEQVESITTSHNYMVRSGMISQVASGIYSYLPLGWRSLRKVEAIIREENIPPYFNNGQGYVGWVPKGAFPSLDLILFGDETKGIESLDHYKISPPVFTQEGAFLVMIVNGPEERELSDRMRIQSEEESVKKWISEEWRTASDEGTLEINMDSTLYEWIAAQVQESRVRSFGEPSAESPE